MNNNISNKFMFHTSSQNKCLDRTSYFIYIFYIYLFFFFSSRNLNNLFFSFLI